VASRLAADARLIAQFQFCGHIVLVTAAWPAAQMSLPALRKLDRLAEHPGPQFLRIHFPFIEGFLIRR
jgi:hypothetical protein